MIDGAIVQGNIAINRLLEESEPLISIPLTAYRTNFSIIPVIILRRGKLPLLRNRVKEGNYTEIRGVENNKSGEIRD